MSPMRNLAGWRSIARSKLARRALFVAVNLAAAALVYALLAAPVVRLLDEGAEAIAERRATLARYEAIGAQEDAVREYVKKVKDGNARGELIEGASEGIVDANLQARLKSWAEGAGVGVRSIQALPIKALRGSPLIGARLDVTGTIESVHALVRALESEAPLLLVTTAAMRQQSSFWQLGAQPKQNVEAHFDVYGGASPKERP